MFKPGESVKCIDITNKSFRGVKPKNKTVKWLSKGKIYDVLESKNPYNKNILIINHILFFLLHLHHLTCI